MTKPAFYIPTNSLPALQAFLGLGKGREGEGTGSREGKSGNIPLNVTFRPHDLGGKINQSEHHRNFEFWTGFLNVLCLCKQKLRCILAHFTTSFADREQTVTPMLWASSTWSWMIISRGHITMAERPNHSKNYFQQKSWRTAWNIKQLPKPVGKTTRTSRPFKRCSIAWICSCFSLISWPKRADKSRRTSFILSISTIKTIVAITTTVILASANERVYQALVRVGTQHLMGLLQASLYFASLYTILRIIIYYTSHHYVLYFASLYTTLGIVITKTAPACSR